MPAATSLHSTGFNQVYLEPHFPQIQEWAPHLSSFTEQMAASYRSLRPKLPSSDETNDESDQPSMKSKPPITSRACDTCRQRKIKVKRSISGCHPIDAAPSWPEEASADLYRDTCSAMADVRLVPRVLNRAQPVHIQFERGLSQGQR